MHSFFADAFQRALRSFDDARFLVLVLPMFVLRLQASCGWVFSHPSVLRASRLLAWGSGFVRAGASNCRQRWCPPLWQTTRSSRARCRRGAATAISAFLPKEGINQVPSGLAGVMVFWRLPARLAPASMSSSSHRFSQPFKGDPRRACSWSRCSCCWRPAAKSTSLFVRSGRNPSAGGDHSASASHRCQPTSWTSASTARERRRDSRNLAASVRSCVL
jgi:hypothetical protein